MKSLQPLHDRVLVKRMDSSKEESKGGIIIPDTAKDKPVEGEVIAVGNGTTLESGKRLNLEVKVGDRVLFGKYGGTEIQIDDTEFLIMREEEILAILSAAPKPKGAAA